jgi:hypothetical protein
MARNTAIASLNNLEDFQIRYEFARGLATSNDPHNFVTEIKGVINFLDEEESYVWAGELLIRKVEIGLAIDAEVPLAFIFDSFDDDLASYYYEFCPEGQNDLTHLEDVIAAGFGTDLLILDRLEIAPRFRKCNLGLVVMLQAMSDFSGGSFCFATKPFPLQFGLYKGASAKEKKIKGLDKFEKNESVATRKIKEYWKKIGFFELPGESDILIASPIVRRPKAEQIFGKNKKPPASKR